MMQCYCERQNVECPDWIDLKQLPSFKDTNNSKNAEEETLLSVIWLHISEFNYGYDTTSHTESIPNADFNVIYNVQGSFKSRASSLWMII